MIKDSGTRREFSTGAVRDIQEGKGRCDLLPLEEVGAIIGSTMITDIYEYTETENVADLHRAINHFCKEKGWSVPKAMLEVSIHFEEGCKKYGENNWRKGIPEHCYIDSAVRHYLKWRDGWADEPHDRAVIWNLLCLIWTHNQKFENKSCQNDDKFKNLNMFKQFAKAHNEMWELTHDEK